MKKSRYYFETTMFNFPFDSDETTKMEITKKIFDKWSSLNAEMHISEIVLQEIERAPEPKRTEMIRLIQTFSPKVLAIDEETKTLAERYIQEGLIPVKYRNDALHIAVAVVNDLDVVLSWNLEHIVKLKTRQGVNGINRLMGFKEIEIAMPEEVI